MWHWTCCRIVFRSSSCSLPWLNCILMGMMPPCDRCVFFTLPHGGSLQTPFSLSFPTPSSPLEIDTVSFSRRTLAVDTFVNGMIPICRHPHQSSFLDVDIFDTAFSFG